jgi:hypothetical protein
MVIFTLVLRCIQNVPHEDANHIENRLKSNQTIHRFYSNRLFLDKHNYYLLLKGVMAKGWYFGRTGDLLGTLSPVYRVHYIEEAWIGVNE